MTTPNAILLDLSSGPSTSQNIAERLRVPALTIDALVRRHVAAGLVETATANNGLITWKLTTAGREQCPPPAPAQFPKNRNRTTARQ